MSVTYITYPLTLTVDAFTVQLGQYLAEREWHSTQVLAGTLIMGLGVFLTSYTKSFIAFLCSYSLMLGTGLGLAYVIPVKLSWLFFPKNKGRTSGIIFMFYSIGAIAWISLTSHLANPNNIQPTLEVEVGVTYELLYEPDSEVVANVPRMFRVMGTIFMCLGCLAGLLIKRKERVQQEESLLRHPDNEILAEYGTNEEKDISLLAEYDQTVHTLSHLTFMEAIKTWYFWHLFLMFYFSMAFTYFMKGEIKNYGSLSFNDDHYLSRVS